MRTWLAMAVVAGTLITVNTAQDAKPAAPQAAAAGKAAAALPGAGNTVLASRPRGSDPRLAAIAAAISPARIKEIDTKLVSFGTRVSTSESESTATRGAVPARAWIESQFQAISDANGGRLKVSIDTFPVPKGPRVPVDQTMSNVVAILPGIDPNDHRIFVVSGHYDSIPADFNLDAPGANDDASGTIVSLECARALSKYQFPATIEFLTVEGEEQGLDGSTHAANAAKAAGEDIAAMLDDDIVGGDQTPGRENRDKVRIFSEGVPARATPQELAQIVAFSRENDSPSREVARFSAELAKQYLPGFQAVLEYRPDRFQRGGDNEPFVRDGYRGIRYTEFNENANHQHLAIGVNAEGVETGDVQKWVSPTYIANVARLNALTLAALASSPLPPERVYFRGGQDIGTPIQWSAVEGAAGYRVLLRPTADAQWTERVVAPAVLAPPPPARPGAAPVGDASPAEAAPAAPPMYQITIPESGDNYIIAMVSVDKEGHESLPTLASTAPRGGGRGGRGRGGAPGTPGAAPGGRGGAPGSGGGSGTVGGGGQR